MQPTNKILEYLHTFPEPYKSQALENYDPKWWTGDVSSVDNPATALYKAFSWVESSQRDLYWNLFYRRLLNGEVLLTTSTDTAIIPTEPTQSERLIKIQEDLIKQLEINIALLTNENNQLKDKVVKLTTK